MARSTKVQYLRRELEIAERSLRTRRERLENVDAEVERLRKRRTDAVGRGEARVADLRDRIKRLGKPKEKETADV